MRPCFVREAQGSSREAFRFARKTPGSSRKAFCFARKAPGSIRKASCFAREAPGSGCKAFGFAREAPGSGCKAFGFAREAPGSNRKASCFARRVRNSNGGAFYLAGRARSPACEGLPALHVASASGHGACAFHGQSVHRPPSPVQRCEATLGAAVLRRRDTPPGAPPPWPPPRPAPFRVESEAAARTRPATAARNRLTANCAPRRPTAGPPVRSG